MAIPTELQEMVNIIVAQSGIVELAKTKKRDLVKKHGYAPEIDNSAKSLTKGCYIGPMQHKLQDAIQDQTRIKGAHSDLDIVNHLSDLNYRGSGDELRVLASSSDAQGEEFFGLKVTKNCGLYGKTSCIFKATPCGHATNTQKGLSSKWKQSRLLTGLKIWLAFESTRHNLEIYQTACGLGDLDGFSDTCRLFRGGVHFFQYPGQTVRIPSFWPCISFTLVTSTSADCQHALIQDLPYLLEHVKTITECLFLFEGGQRKLKSGKSAKKTVAALSHVLEGDETSQPGCRGIQQVLRDRWDELKRDLQPWITQNAQVDEAINAVEPWREEALENISGAWFEQGWVRSLYECSICHKSFEKSMEKYELCMAFDEHFYSAHWFPSPPPSSSPLDFITEEIIEEAESFDISDQVEAAADGLQGQCTARTQNFGGTSNNLEHSNPQNLSGPEEAPIEATEREQEEHPR